MNNLKEFDQGMFYRISSYIYWFILTNIYFFCCNLIFIIVFMLLEPIFANIIFIYISLIPTGPAIVAVSYVMDKLVREKEISPTKDFFYGYRLNFKDAIKTWLPLLTAIFIIIIDLQYFYQEQTTFNQIMAIVFLVALILLICLLLYIFPITAKFKFRTRDIYKLSIYYSFKYVKISTGNIGIFIIALFLMSITTDLFFFFTASIISYLLALNSKTVMEDIQVNFTK